VTPHPSASHVPKILFGNGFDAPLWAAVFAADKGSAGKGEVQAILPGSQVVFAATAVNETSLRIGSGEWVLRRQEALVARHFDPAPLRLRGNGEELLVLGFRLAVLAALLEPFRPGLLDPVRRTVFGTERNLSSVLPLRTGRAAELVDSMRRPPVGGAALPFWYEGHVKAWLACACFEEVPAEQREFFCSKQKRLADERIETAKAILKARGGSWLEPTTDE